MLKLDNLSSIQEEAAKIGRLKSAVLSPEDVESLKATKEAYERGYIAPVLLGDERKILATAEKISFDVGPFEKVFEQDRQKIADIGAEMLFSGAVDIASKGQIPTSHIYKAMIKSQKKNTQRRRLAVVTLYEIKGRFVAITDTGVNINPDWETKLEEMKNAIFLLNILGYQSPRVLIFSASREIKEELESRRDAELIRDKLDAEITIGSLIDCEGLPDIILAPHLDTGNIFSKIGYIVNLDRRCSIMLTAGGPVTVPSRSDDAPQMVNDIALGIIVAHRLKAHEHEV